MVAATWRHSIIITLSVFYVVLAGIHFDQHSTIIHSDSYQYLEVAKQSITDGDFWFSGRPFTVPLFFKMMGGNPEAIALGQLAVSILAWLTLAFSVSRMIQSNLLSITSFAIILYTGLATFVIIWQRTILSESLSVSLFVLLLAVVIQAVHHPTQRPKIAFLAILVGLLWSATHMANTYMLLLCGLLLTSAILKRYYRWISAIGLTFILIGIVQNIAFSNSNLWKHTLIHMMCNWVLLDEEGRRYFLERDMPTTGLECSNNAPIWFYQVEWDSFGDWLDTSARRIYIGYLIEHPQAVTQGVMDNWPRLITGSDHFPAVFNSWYLFTDEDPSTAERLSNQILFSSQHLESLSAVAIVLGILIFIKRPDRRIALAGVFLVGVLPRALLVFVGDTMEIERHSVLTYVQLRLAVWMLLLFSLEQWHQFPKHNVAASPTGVSPSRPVSERRRVFR